jgi:hypothetical protein
MYINTFFPLIQIEGYMVEGKGVGNGLPQRNSRDNRRIS